MTNKPLLQWRILAVVFCLWTLAVLDTFGQSVSVPGFRPSTSSFRFINSFPSMPYFTIEVSTPFGTAQVPIGDASNGMCGGMGYAVRDYFEAGIPIPCDQTAPAGGPLFDYLSRRLFESFNLPLGPAKYALLMREDLPDHETWFSELGLAPHGRAWVMIREEWPWIKSDLDSGILSPMGLIRVKTNDVSQMGKNHQVLAYGYDLSGDDLTIYVYDPNYPNQDDVTISLNIGNPKHTTAVSYSKGEAMYCFFRPGYSFSTPPAMPDLTPPTVQCPGNIAVTASPGEQSARVVFNVGASDDCSTATVSCNPPSGSSFPGGATVVHCTATDAAGNFSACSFTVTVTVPCPLPATGDGLGLLATYYDNADFTVPKAVRIEAVNFDWGARDPMYGVGADTFSVRWSGQVMPRYTDTYTFWTVSDDGVRLWVDGRQIINDWNDHAPQENSGTISLLAGRKYDIVMEYYENGGGAAAHLLWSSTCQPKEIIPVSHLFPEPPKCSTGCGPEFFSDFNAGVPRGLTLFGDASIQNGWLRLTTTDNAYGIAYLNDFSCGRPVTSFHATFKAALFGSTCCGGGMNPADGFSFNLVPAATVRANPGYAEPAEEGLNEGLAVNFDTWDNGPDGFGDVAPAIEVKWLGQVLGRTSFQSSQSPLGVSDPNAAAREVIIDLAENGTLNVSYGGTPVLVNVPTPYNAAIIGTPKWVLGARNGAANDNHWVGDLRIVARTQTGSPIPGLLNTGVDVYGALLPAGAVDPNYHLVQSADPARSGPNALVVEEGWPVAPAPNGPWLANGPRSKWIAPQPAQSIGNEAGEYTYEIPFDLTGLEPATAKVSGQWATDDPGLDILINGQSTGQASVGFTSWTPFQITSGFQPGMNRLTFVLRNGGTSINPTGLRVEMCGTALPRCLSFEQFQPMPLPDPWTFLGDRYRVYDFNGAPWPYPEIRTDRDLSGLHFTGLNCGYRLEIDLAQPCYAVELRLVHFSSPGVVTAYNAGGAVVASKTMTAPQWRSETVALAGAGITKVVVTAPSNEMLLLNLCARAEYPPRPIEMNISRQNGQTVLCWSSRPGKTYCLQYKTNAKEDWMPHAAGCITADSSSTCVWETSNDPLRFYRVVEAP